MKLEDVVVTIDGKKIAVALSDDDGWYEFTPVEKDDEEAVEAAERAFDTQATYRNALAELGEANDGRAVDPWDRMIEWLRDQFGDDAVTFKRVAEEGDAGKVY